MPHGESHRTQHIGWLRAAVLGANDGIISTSSLMVGVAAASSGPRDIIVAGVAGLAAGALSMAAGEYVSVSSQADTERAELDRERKELAADPQSELRELTEIYVARGLRAELAATVAQELMAKDALGAHARDELGLSETLTARPVQAAIASAGSFAVGAALPLGGRGHGTVARIGHDCRRIAGRVMRAGSLVGSHWRGAADSRGTAGDVLGSHRHGADGRCRLVVRDRSVTGHGHAAAGR